MISALILLAGTAQAADIQPSLLTQIQATVFDQDVDPQADPATWGDPEDDPGFKVRRARAGFEGSDEDFIYGVVLGMSSGFDAISSGSHDVGVVDAYGGWRMTDTLAISAGVQKVPFGRELLMSAGEILFQDRSLISNHIAPGRDVGILLDTHTAGAHLQAGVFNGNNELLGDDNPGFLFAGRASYTIGGDEPVSTHGRVDNLIWSTGSNVAYNQGLATDELDLGADLLLRVGALAVLAEVQMATITPTASDVAEPDVLAATTMRGGTLQVGYSHGAWEPALRVEYFDSDTAHDNNGDLMVINAGVTGHFADDHFRAGVGFVHREELGGNALANDTAKFWFQVKH